MYHVLSTYSLWSHSYSLEAIMAVIVLNVLWFLSFSGVLSYYFYQPTVSDCGWCSLQGMWCDILKVFGCCHSENTLLMFNYLPTWGAGEGKGKGCVMAVGGWTPLDGFIYTLALTPSISALWLRVKRERDNDWCVDSCNLLSYKLSGDEVAIIHCRFHLSDVPWRRRSVAQRGCRSRLGPL